MDRFSEVRAFICVAELGSFSAAAERLGISRPMMTKLVSGLEQRLGVRLIHRTTRRLSLTEAGSSYLAQASGLLTEWDDLDARLSQAATAPAGRLRVAAPVSFGVRYLGQVVAGFSQRYPHIELELSLSDRRVDLVEEGFDLAIRVSNLVDSSLVARPLAQVRDYLLAAPSYLEQHGTPQAPQELTQHPCLLYTLTQTPYLWNYQAADGSCGSVRVKGPLQANNGDVLLEAAIHGMGLILQPDFLAERALRDGTLLRVLPDYQWHCLALSALYPVRQHVPGKVRVFVDYLQQFFAQDKSRLR
jgi:DNA-binding transcriptional LysR family regulator